MQLYGSLTSPYVRKIRVALALKGVDYRFEETIPWNDDSPVHQINPLGKVPVLKEDNGAVWYDSAVIAEVLEARVPQPALFPTETEARLQVRQLQALADGICDAGVLIFLERKREPAQQSEVWIARQETKINKGVAALARHLGDRSVLVGDSMTHADIAALCVLQWLDIRAGLRAWKDAYPELARWVESQTRQPAFAETVPPAA